MIYQIYEQSESKRGRDDTSFLNRISTYVAPPAKRSRTSSADSISSVGSTSTLNSVSPTGTMVVTPYGPGRVVGERGVRMGHRVFEVQLVARNGCPTGCAVIYLKENDMQVI
uniref:Uncharacterized protein n=1 Tax=Odontella aurita TaxID=265563 RepID=A0A7S4M804_9STRA|mmetsp:Transcript_13412/g.39225  ORF Transcript_13412/g.39225 Transcript_13412/m.39225 type:complete len:112 (+) Transcript_13412:181-516(+)|eukprot:CAMPEP_0113529224 /NCGR_PEP_ID=MMETSP0015_2-20120614/2278_1 /TAXON_ID=2838 /ORGANISM="Odontella" /LENGTH=111 /DNA_ID=CAMNT_0000427837 /DNA_START=114 /DNA_END=449 /DNA_ORIENTATION=- /assembly_acc=CAM_ASM_000160